MRLPAENIDPLLAPEFAPVSELTGAPPSFGQALIAGFQAESPVYAAWAWANTRVEADPNWDWKAAWDAEPLVRQYPDRLGRAQSQAEFEAIRANILAEQENQQLLASAGWKGFVAAAVGGIVSPTTLIPFSGQYKGVKGVAEAFALAAAASTADEAALFGLQETRTWQDFAIGVGAGTVLGGLLGSAGVVLRQGEAEAIVGDMASGRGPMTISHATEDGAVEELQFNTIEVPRSELEQSPVYQQIVREVETSVDDLTLDDLRAEGRTDAEIYGEFDFTPATRAILPDLDAVRRYIETRDLDLTPDRLIEAAEASKRTATDEAVLPSVNTFDLAEVAPDLIDIRARIARHWEVRRQDAAFLEDTGEEIDSTADSPYINKAEMEAILDNFTEELSAEDYAAIRDNFVRETAEEFALRADSEGADRAMAWAEDELRARINEALEPRRIADKVEEVNEWNRQRDLEIEQLRSMAAKPATPEQVNVGPRNLSAADPRVVPGRLLRGNRVTGKAIDVLARLNPLTRMLNSRFSSARRIAAQLQIPGVRLEGADVLGPAARGGTIYDRAMVHQAKIAEFVQAYDEAYARYLYGNNLPRFGPRTMAQIKSGLNMVPPGKLNYHDFGERVFDSLNTGEDLGDPSMGAAVRAGRDLVEYFEKIAKDYHDYRKVFDGDDAPALFKPLEFEESEENLAGLLHYMHHMYDTNYIIANQDQFLNDLETHYTGLINASFQRAFNTYRKARDKAQEYLQALEMTPERAQAQLDQIEAELEEIESSPLFVNSRERLAEARTNWREIGLDEATIRQELKALEADLGPDYAELVSRRRELSRQRKVFLNAGAGADEKYQKLLEDIDRQTRMQFDELDRVVAATRRVDKKLAKVSDEVLDERLAKDVLEMRRAIASFNKGNKKLRELETSANLDEGAVETALGKQLNAERRLARAAERLEASQTFDRAKVRSEIEEILRLSKEAVQERNAKRAVRAEMMKEKAKKLTPEELELRRNEERIQTKLRLQNLEDDFDATWRAKGAEDLNLTRGEADFSARARENSHLLLNKITGNENRVVGLDLLAGERGPELARTLNLPFDIKKKYLIRQPEYVFRSYAHSMAPDLEMYRATGSSNGNVWFRELDDEFQRARERIASDPKLNAAQREKAFQKFDAEIKEVRRDLQVLIDRLRHRRGIPVSPNGFGYRAGRMAQAANVFRFMGTVAVSSIADVARPVFYYGLNKTFRQAWVPFLTDMKRFKAQKEANIRAGIALDPILHNRAHQIFDIGENYSTNQTAAERGVEFLANKTGLVALFDQWNAYMKHISSSVVNVELSHALRVIAEGRTGPERQLALDQLTFANIGEENAARIWDQFMKDGGSTEFEGGVRIPNTEAWDDPEAAMMFNQAMNKLANSDIIITPGLDRPSWVDENMAYRLVAQFRSFTFSSTNRIMMAGLQRPDMALLQGALFSVALGAISYYTWAMSRGGSAQENMQNATMEAWIYESVHRSGLLGVLSEGVKVGEQIPWLNDYAIFGGEQRNTRMASSVMGQIFGPTYDLSERLISTVQGLNDPTQSTVHNARVALVPYQNVFYLARLLDAIEGAFNETFDIPERRQ